MGTITLTLPTAGGKITAGLHSTNYSLLQALLNGNIDNTNIAAGAAIAKSKLAALNIVNADVDAAAAIALSKLAGYPSDATKFARGDGTWAVPAGIRGVFRASRTTNQSITNGTTQKIALTTEDYDQNGWFDNVTNYRYTPLVAGWYNFNALVDTTDSWNAGVAAKLLLYKNGALFRTLWAVTDGMNVLDNSTWGGSTIAQANGTTDYFELFFQNGDAAVHTIQAAFDGHLLAAT